MSVHEQNNSSEELPVDPAQKDQDFIEELRRIVAQPKIRGTETREEDASEVKTDTEPLMKARAIGAQQVFAGRLGLSANIPEQAADARQIGMSWLETGQGSHTMRTIAEIAYTSTAKSAIRIYADQLARWKTDRQPGGIGETIRHEIGRYDNQFIMLGAAAAGISRDEFDEEGSFDTFSKRRAAKRDDK